jgi:hypothetical protein
VKENQNDDGTRDQDDGDVHDDMDYMMVGGMSIHKF